MDSTQIADRIQKRASPKLAVRLIPQTCFDGWLGRADRLYVCLGDYEELQGLTVGEAADRLYGGLRDKDANYKGFANHQWRIAWHHEPPAEDDRTQAASRAEAYYVVTVATDDDSVDLFPGTWKAIAYIVTDQVRMRERADLRDGLLAIHGGATPFGTRRKEGIDFLEYDWPGNSEDSENVQAKYYAYLAHDSLFANELLEPFGIYNRCWHGRGYIGAYGELWCRVFLGRNLPLKHECVISCELLTRDALLPIRSHESLVEE